MIILHKTGSVVGSDLAAGLVCLDRGGVQPWRGDPSRHEHVRPLCRRLVHRTALGLVALSGHLLRVGLDGRLSGDGLSAQRPHPGSVRGIFGVFAAVIGWLLLYGKYLSASGRRRLWQNVLTNLVLISEMSYMIRNYVSHWGHIGGAIGGFVSCFSVPHARCRFGPSLRLASGGGTAHPLAAAGRLGHLAEGHGQGTTLAGH